MSANIKRGVLGLGLIAVLGGCSGYVKREDFDSAMNDLRARDSAIEAKTDANAAALAAIRNELQAKFSEYDKAIAEVAGKLRIDTMAHFDYDSATLREDDKPALDHLAKVIGDHHRGSLITVEGFTDPAGAAGFNKRLGQKRADAVRSYLVETGGLPADSARAVSYGESSDRLVVKAWGAEGLPNRRAALVVDRVGS